MNNARRLCSILLLLSLLMGTTFGFADSLSGSAKGNAPVYVIPTAENQNILGYLDNGTTLENLRTYQDGWYVFTYRLGQSSGDAYLPASYVQLSSGASSNAPSQDSAASSQKSDASDIASSIVDTSDSGAKDGGAQSKSADSSGSNTSSASSSGNAYPLSSFDPENVQYAKVSLARTDEKLMLRAKPESNADVIEAYPHDYVVAVVRKDVNTDWTEVYTQNERQGFMKTEFLSFQQPDGSWVGGQGSTGASSIVSTVETPNVQSQAIESQTKDILDVDQTPSEPTQEPPAEIAPLPVPATEAPSDLAYARVSAPSGDQGARMHVADSEASEAKAIFANDYVFVVLQRGDAWTEVSSGDMQGFVRTDYLSFQQPDGSWVPGQAPAPTEEPTPAVQETPIAVETLPTEETPPAEETTPAAEETATEPTPEPTAEDARYARVSLASGEERLSLYAEASEASQVLDSYTNEYIVKVIADGDEWTQVDAGNAQGYMPTAALAFQQADGSWTGGQAAPEATEPTEPTPAPEAGTGDEVSIETQYAKVALPGATDTLNLYTEANDTSAVMGAYANEYMLQVIARGDEWTQVDAGDAQGYMRTDSLAFQQADGSFVGGKVEAEETPPPTDEEILEQVKFARVALASVTDSAAVHEEAAASSDVVDYFPNNTIVRVLDSDTSWTEVAGSNEQGFVETKLLSFQLADGTWTSASTGTDTTPDTTTLIGTLSMPANTYAYIRLEAGQSTVRVYDDYTDLSQNFTDYALSNGARVTVDTLINGFAWIDFTFNSTAYSGYIRSSQLTFDSIPNNSGLQDSNVKVSLPSNMQALPMYEEARDTSLVYGHFRNGTVFDLIQKGPVWTRVKIDDQQEGYMQTAYLAFLENGVWVGGQEGINPGLQYAYVNTNSTVVRADLRSYPSTAIGSTINSYLSGTRVIVLGWGPIWSTVRIEGDGQEGFMQTAQLSLTWPPTGGGVGPGGYYAMVNNPNPRDWLNLRSFPSRNATVLSRHWNGEAVLVLEYGAEWCKVQVNGVVGYMMTSYLSFSGSGGGGQIPNPGSGYAVVNNPNPKDRLNLRAQPTVNSTSLGRYYNGTSVKILSYDATWCYVEVQGKVGYMMTYYLSFGGSGGSGGGSGGISGNATVNVNTTLNLRAGPNTSSAILGSYRRGTPVTVREYGSGWCYVEVYGRVGYMMTQYLSFTGSGGGTSPNMATIYNPIATQPVPLRVFPNDNSVSLGNYYNGTPVRVLTYGSEWSQVEIGTLTGYIQTRYLVYR